MFIDVRDNIDIFIILILFTMYIAKSSQSEDGGKDSRKKVG